MYSHHDDPSIATQAALLSLLRGQPPAGEPDGATVEAILRRYECGGYLHALWSRAGRTPELPEEWRGRLAGAHRKTAVDNLAALAEFRAFGRILAGEGIPFILLKGAAYLVDLYDDPGARVLTDIDLLVRRPDAGRIARRLAAAGFVGTVGPQFPEDRRFEMFLPGGNRCRFEIHWWIGAPFRFAADQEGLWERSRRATLEGVPCRILGPEDALLYHVAHLADHYFGPTLKWVIDLREMLRRVASDPGELAGPARVWGIRTALYLALRHLAKIFPEDSPPGFASRLRPGPLRRRLLSVYLSSKPLDMMEIGPTALSRYPLRLLLLDRPSDALGLMLTVLSRSLVRWRRAAPPWKWLD